ncbi:MAG: PilZ domain-containing protein [Nitratireductor sp.]
MLTSSARKAQLCEQDFLPEASPAGARQNMDNREKRRFARIPARDISEIFLPGSRVPLTCMVHNLSEHGAMLETSEPNLPDRFILTNHARRNRMVCEVAWRSGTRLGVRFATPPRSLR